MHTNIIYYVNVYSWLIDSTCHPLRKGVSRFWLSKYLWKVCVKYSSMQTPSTVSVLRKPVFSLLRRTIKRLSQVLALKTLKRMRSSKSLDLETTSPTRNREDQIEMHSP